MKLGLCCAPSCAGIPLTVAMALSCRIAVWAYCAVARLFAPKLCTVERTGQEAEAKIGVILALCR